MAYNSINSERRGADANDYSTLTSDRNDRNFRIFSEGVTTNQKVYKESTTLAKVNVNLSNLRTKQKHFYERVPQERIDEYQKIRIADIDRNKKMVNNRFPELSAAREAFLGEENKLPPKTQQANEVVKFSEIVEKLAQEEEPFPARAQMQSMQVRPADGSGEASHNSLEDRSRSLNVGHNRGNNAAKSTLSSSIKTKYIVRSRHNELTAVRFLPVNQSQARSMVRKDMVHDAGQPKRLDFEGTQRSTMIRKSIHGQSVFRNTSPVTQDQFRAKPSCTLDSANEFRKFCPPDQGQKNARLAVLDNFREISRIMTQNFLTHKKLEKRYEKTAIPRSELTKMKEEEQAQQRMTSILKKMHSPSNFAAPQILLPGETASSPYRSVMAQHNGSQLASMSARKHHSPSSVIQSASKANRSKFVSQSKDDEIY